MIGSRHENRSVFRRHPLKSPLSSIVATRLPISYRDLELMLLDRGVEVDHTTIFRWIQAYAEELEKRIRGGERARGDRSRRVGSAGAADCADRRRTGRLGDAGGLMGGRRPSPPRERSRGRS